jgi:hypothetical protein
MDSQFSSTQKIQEILIKKDFSSCSRQTKDPTSVSIGGYPHQPAE